MTSVVRRVTAVRFGPFEVDLANRILRKGRVRIKLQAQPFAVLVALLEAPGSVVTREQLRQTLWPHDTFVDFEHGLNAAVGRLRQALSDSAGRSRYIETLPKRGYRFIAELESTPIVVSENSYPVRRNARQRFVTGAAAVSVIAVLLLAHLYSARRDTASLLRASPLTTFPGRELDPALSPDGNSVAFSWNGEEGENFDIYVMRVGWGAPVRLTTHPDDDVGPVWSPDGHTIAFTRASTSTELGKIVLIPASGGPERELVRTRNQELRTRPLGRQVSTMAWSPDGASLAASHREPSDSCERIYLFSLGGDVRPLTSPPRGTHGDYMPAFSPDGHSIAFSRLSGYSAAELWLQSLDRNLLAVDQGHQLTDHNRWAANPAWMPDGRLLLFVLSERPDAVNGRELRIIGTSGDPASEHTIPLDVPPYQFSAGRRLVYSTYIEEVDIWRARVPGSGEPPSIAEPLVVSTRPDTKARYSPDGKTIAFVSERSGSPEIWSASSDGSNAARLTSFGGPLMGPPAWSPDGKSLVFHCRPEGQSDLFTIHSSGGPPKRLTTGAADDTMPVYSNDGRQIYFTSLRSGQRQIWSMPTEGGAAVQLTTRGGNRPIPSPDGNTVYYASDSRNSIWQVPSTGGIEREVVASVHDPPFGFAVTSGGIYYPSPPHSGDHRYIRFFSFASGESRPVVQIDKPVGWTLNLSPDERYLLFDQWEKPKIDLLLVDNFRNNVLSVLSR